MNYIEIKSPAKINIGLNILNKRHDGFHNLQTIFYPLYDLYDLIKIKKSDHFYFESNNEILTNDESNLIIKAVKLLEKTTQRSFNVEIELIKNIPMGAGLGGGSSNAATVLVSLNEMFKLGIQYDQMIDLALELGSDVPFFIKSKPSIGFSRGETLKQIDLDIVKPILIVNPGIHISTKEAFASVEIKQPKLDFNQISVSDLSDYNYLKKNLTNDFEEFVFSKYPEIGSIKSTMYEMGAKYSLMSGSGSTVYGIFEKVSNAKTALDHFPADYLKLVVNNN
ncbi:MAG: 4-(cytidine 5'-diphospho)-2-C-methyl-D-erythritol kinase [Ignavibacteria bacterium]|jgi:4-diphosphocytidyl-2-C-methyl-D-erythritol kinase